MTKNEKLKLVTYRKKLSLQVKNKNLAVKTDTGDQLMSFCRSTISEWYQSQSPSEFRQLAKEQFQYLNDAFNYRNWRIPQEWHFFFPPGGDRWKPYDLSVMRVPELNIWVVFTHQHSWFQVQDGDQINLEVSDSFPAITDASTQEHIWGVRESERRQSNR